MQYRSGDHMRNLEELYWDSGEDRGMGLETSNPLLYHPQVDMDIKINSSL